jgi:membrane associated rhomboid family serine protease
MTDDAERPDQAPRKEPAFNAPLMAVILPLLIVGCYALQISGGRVLENVLLDSFALSPVLLRQGNFELLFTHIFLHGSWTHVLFNAVACLIFATPVIRAFGKGAGAVLSFFAFFFLCGMAAGLGYCLLNLSSAVPVVGASGAIYGLIGASSRIAGVRGVSGGIVPLTNSRVLSSAAVWIGINLATALLPILLSGQGIVIAWQAHIAGYLFGVLVIGHWLKAFHPRFFTTS